LTAAGLNFVDMSCLPGRVMFMSWIGEHELQPLAQHEFVTDNAERSCNRFSRGRLPVRQTIESDSPLN